MKRLSFFTKCVIVAVAITNAQMCGIYQPIIEAEKAYDGENFAGAKLHLQRYISHGYFQDHSKSEVYLDLAIVHGRLGEYDSMQAALDTCIKEDANSRKQVREVVDNLSLLEFNQGVIAYNSFLFKIATIHFTKAIKIYEGFHKGSPEEYEMLTLRCIGLSAWAGGDIDNGISNLKKAAEAGDGLSKKVLETYEKEKKLDKPEKLEPRERKELKI